MATKAQIAATARKAFASAGFRAPLRLSAAPTAKNTTGPVHRRTALPSTPASFRPLDPRRPPRRSPHDLRSRPPLLERLEPQGFRLVGVKPESLPDHPRRRHRSRAPSWPLWGPARLPRHGAPHGTDLRLT